MFKEKQKVLVAVHLILEKDNQILLARRYNTGYEDGNYSMVAGHVDEYERAKQAMVREAHEEAGIIIDEESLEVVHTMHRKSDQWRIDFFLQAKEWERAPRIMEPDKCDDLRWFGATEIPANTIPYIKFALENIAQGKKYSEFGWD
jgi:8-oxo-dGTP diphosphatase